MKLWFDQKFHSQPYSLQRSMQTINQLINKIKPTDQIRRLPRSLDHLSFFKASEYQSWMLFYSIPVLSLFLPPDYVQHLSLLVSSMHILLSDNLKIDDLDKVHSMLRPHGFN